ncbi:MAG: arsenate reductase ArsC [Chloroflexi bacterium]|nr:arsenate reductase ArsC [Chloroflexota bacterium]
MNRIRVLFLCTGNSARSIIGAALLRQIGGDAFDVHSAGTAPKGINPCTVRVLAAAGIDASGERSKHVSEYDGQAFDYVITVCDDAAEQCPVFPGAPQRLHWSLPDPAAVTGADAGKLAAFERTLRDLRERVEAFVTGGAGLSRV